MWKRGESGQAVVEAAVVLPATIFLLLLTIQLTQLQQARLMVEYAAFNAARVGIVRNGDNGSSNGFDGPMHEAATLSVLPSFGRADNWTELGKTLAKFKAQDTVLRPFGLSQVRVYVLSPRRADFARLGGHLNKKELDFDDVRPEAAEATLLSVQVRYLYELRVPFANKLLQRIWMATKAGAATVADGTPEGVSLAALTAAGSRGRYFVPVEAFYTMRMQSNPFEKWAHP